MPDKISTWLGKRVPVDAVLAFFREKNVPRHRHAIWYYFGGLTLFFFLVQVVTGILLSFHYTPTPEEAHASIITIVNEVPYGWLMRSLHSWAANLMVGTAFIHMFSTFLMKAYRKPRELLWVSGVLLLFLVLGFGFTGYLLPWDTMAYFATLIGTEVPASVPIIGDIGVGILKGSQEVGAETLTRMHAIHTTILPLITLFMVGFHLLLNQLHGASIPIGTKVQERRIPFFPNFLYRDLLAWTIGFAVLISLASLIPWGLGEKADPFASAPFGIKPEWYFLPLYQTLKIVPSTILSMSGELLVNLLVMAGAGFWLLVPFLDRQASREENSKVFTYIGILLIAYLGLTIYMAYNP